ncbi:MAG TPA: geranylgeranyl reductase family protein [Chloroflexota bacterium]
MDDRLDVVIVGAGPAGAVAALLLARGGFNVALLDRMHFPRPKACAEYLSPGVMEEMCRLGLESDFRQLNPHPVGGMRIVSPGGQYLDVRYETGNGSTPAYTLSRLQLDNMLVIEARRAGAMVLEKFCVRDFEWSHGRVVGVQGTHDGKQETLRSRLTILADGSRSGLARKLHLARNVRWPVRMGLVAHYGSDRQWPGDLGVMHVAHDGYCGVAPMGNRRLNVAVVVPVERFRSAGMPAPAFLEHWIESRPELEHSLSSWTRVTPVRGYSPVGSRVSKAWAPGVLLVGDAAGFFDPFTGEGVFRALRSAKLATDVARDALRSDDLSDHRLAHYAALRAHEFRSKQRVSSLVQLFVQYPGLMNYALPRLRKRRKPSQILANVLGEIESPDTFLAPRVLWSALRP